MRLVKSWKTEISASDPYYAAAVLKGSGIGACAVVAGVLKPGQLQSIADLPAAGHPKNCRVVQPLGLGLDEKAIEAVQKWRFRPALKDGKPVAGMTTVRLPRLRAHEIHERLSALEAT